MRVGLQLAAAAVVGCALAYLVARRRSLKRAASHPQPVEDAVDAAHTPEIVAPRSRTAASGSKKRKQAVPSWAEPQAGQSPKRPAAMIDENEERPEFAIKALTAGSRPPKNKFEGGTMKQRLKQRLGNMKRRMGRRGNGGKPAAAVAAGVITVASTP